MLPSRGDTEYVASQGEKLVQRIRWQLSVEAPVAALLVSLIDGPWQSTSAAVSAISLFGFGLTAELGHRVADVGEADLGPGKR
jgi:hypothetical protein